MSSTFSSFIELTKPRILTMVLVTTTTGFLVAPAPLAFYKLLFTLLGVGLACAGTGVLNHCWEWQTDKLMLRTRNRPLPKGEIKLSIATFYGITLMLLGILILIWKVNTLAAGIVACSGLLYILVYTPLKRVSWLNTPIGAIPGALPPLAGWAAATSALELEAWILFFILFTWQHPHFYAIAWMYREDYQKGGIKVLPTTDPDGKSTFYHTIFYLIVLLLVSLMPAFIGMSGKIYFLGALFIGLLFLKAGLRFSNSKSKSDARLLLKTSIVYLPLLLFFVIMDIGAKFLW